MSEAHELNLDSHEQDPLDQLDLIRDAIDLASDQGQRTWVRWGGKRVAMIVTVDDGERLEKLHQLCHCGPHDWKDDCPLHGAERIGH